MASESELNQFRRLIGDYEIESIDEGVLDDYLDDAAYQATSAEAQFVTVTEFDSLAPRYKTEIIILAAINWWWNKAADLTDNHTTSIGQASQNASEKWERAMQMIERLQAMYENISVLGSEFTTGEISRFSKTSLRRIGGAREEVRLDGI